jgi:hypothetical protein
MKYLSTVFMNWPLVVKYRGFIIEFLGPMEWWEWRRCCVNFDLGVPCEWSLKCSLKRVEEERPVCPI